MNVTFFKSTLYLVPRTEYRTSFFLGGGGRLFEGTRLFQILSLRRSANSKRGAYLKLGANSSIYGTLIADTISVMIHWQLSFSLMNNINATLILRFPVLLKPGIDEIK